MLIPPKYILTPKISQLLSSIEASRELITSISIPTEIETNIRRQSYLKSSLFSARIEGNTLTLDELSVKPSKDQKKVEVFNVLKALNLSLAKRSKDITIKDILKLHSTVMDGLTSELGRFRSEVSAIFNSAGIAVYMPPPPNHILKLLEKLLRFSNSTKELLVPIRACLTHYVFEKIHPFLDGNGRVGRILLQAVLNKGGYEMKGIVSLEEYLDSHRSSYYSGLEENEKDVTDYIEFMLEALAIQSSIGKMLVLEKQNVQPEDYLLPRRAEIFRIIQDHRLVKFDQLRRRFPMTNERTLRFDLKQLQEKGFIQKLGTTKGVYYRPTRNKESL